MLWYSEAPQEDTSNEYSQHMFSLKNKKNNNPTPSYLEIWLAYLKLSLTFHPHEIPFLISETSQWGTYNYNHTNVDETKQRAQWRSETRA